MKIQHFSENGNFLGVEGPKWFLLWIFARCTGNETTVKGSYILINPVQKETLKRQYTKRY